MSHAHSRIPTAVTAATVKSAVASASKCPKCGTTKKSGKLSCCAHGGAWFKKCGDAGDTQFVHTWTEGIQACSEVLVSSLLTETRLQVVLRKGNVSVDLLNMSERRSITQQKMGSIRSVSVSNVGTADYEDCAGFARVVLCICVLSTILDYGNVQTLSRD